MCVFVLTTQASGGNRGFIGSNVLQHHDASAVVPLYADPARCMDQVHAARVLHIKRRAREWKPDRSVVHGHLETDGHRGSHIIHKECVCERKFCE